MSSSTQKGVSMRDLVEEAKKRIVIVVICVVGLSYLMSLTSSSVWVNLPAAASLVILLRYFSLDYDMRRKAVTYNSKPSSEIGSQKKPLEPTKAVQKLDWRRKVNSPVVEDAIDHFTRHIVSEWVSDLWYSRITPDKEGPEELVQIMNGVFGELSSRMRNINIIDLLTRDLIHLICTHLELFRVCQAKLNTQQSSLSIEQRDRELRLVLAAENRLHPALFSTDAEHKVLQHLMDGLISFTFKSADLQCSFFRYVTRELLACVVIRPVLNLVNPRFINERIEIFAISKAPKGVVASEEASPSKPNGSPNSDNFSTTLDPAGTGVELMQLKCDQSKNGEVAPETDYVNGSQTSKDPLLAMDTRSTLSWHSFPVNSSTSKEEEGHHFGGEWGEMLDVISRRKTAALAPENFDDMWAKGRNYQKKGREKEVIKQAPQGSSVIKSVTVDHSKNIFKLVKDGQTRLDLPLADSLQHVVTNQNMSNHLLSTSYHDDNDKSLESSTTSSFTSGEDDPTSVTGLDSPVTKVWDGKTNRNLAVAHFHHPLENPEGHNTNKTHKGHAHNQRLPRSHSGRKRLRSSTQNLQVWQETERTSFLPGDSQDILSLKGHVNADDSSDDSETESLGRFYNAATASSSELSVHLPESSSFAGNSLKNSLMVDTFFKLRCEVLGANIVKSGSRTFAVYSISVTDVNSNSWSIKRRFRHFEELHRRLKEYGEYNLHLPPKHFLSTGLDLPVIQERCILLDEYLKKLLQLPTISGSIEVWDFLSVDSQTYVFSNSFSIIETLSVDLNNKPSEISRTVPNFSGTMINSLTTRMEQQGMDYKESILQTKNNVGVEGPRPSIKGMTHTTVEKIITEHVKSLEDPLSTTSTEKNALSDRIVGKLAKERESDCLEQTSESLLDTASDSTFPSEWVPPNLTVPILDLVDVIFQLQDGGWIRRKAFWVAKQLLHLGMGDALDDWLIEKIQLLRRGSVIASVIKRLEQILWPDGIFITKHPNRQPPMNDSSAKTSPHAEQPTNVSSPNSSSPDGRQPPEISSPRLADEQQLEAERRAKFVHELMIDNAPSTVVGLVGRKEYEQCAKDIYFFLQSSVCLKHLAFDLLELLLLPAFPEMDYIFRQLHEEKYKFGEFQAD